MLKNARRKKRETKDAGNRTGKKAVCSGGSGDVTVRAKDLGLPETIIYIYIC